MKEVVRQTSHNVLPEVATGGVEATGWEEEFELG
jgi:hypothetical protein